MCSHDSHAESAPDWTPQGIPRDRQRGTASMSSGRSAPTTDEVARYAERAAAAGIETTRTPRQEATAAISAACRGETVATVLPFDVDLPAGATVDPTTAHLEAADTGVTAGTLAVAEYGTVVVTPTTRKEGSVSLLPERHVAVVRASDVVADMLAGFDRLGEAFAAGRNDAVLVTGPSATADMGELVEGVHGPAEMHVVIVGSEP